MPLPVHRMEHGDPRFAPTTSDLRRSGVGSVRLECKPTGSLTRRLNRCLRVVSLRSIQPSAYGNSERVVSYLTEALVELGHDVTLILGARTSK